MLKNNKIIALVGMCGAGKSEVADFFIHQGFTYLRFGQITLDEVKKRGLAPKEENERPIREEFRRLHGMAAYAVLNMPKISDLLSQGKKVLADGLLSWSEYKALKEKYGDLLVLVAVFASPKIRYSRLVDRRSKYKDDPHMKYRSFSPEEAASRDYSEIENLEKGGPIAMADFMINNIGSLDELRAQAGRIYEQIKNEKY